jgi:hypothetical protein
MDYHYLSEHHKIEKMETTVHTRVSKKKKILSDL